MLSAARYPIVLYGPLRLPPILPHNLTLYAWLRDLHTDLNAHTDKALKNPRQWPRERRKKPYNLCECEDASTARTRCKAPLRSSYTLPDA